MISEGAAAALLTATVTSLWIGGLVTIGVVLLIRCLSLRPQVRYRLWTLALAVVVMAPLSQRNGRQVDSMESPFSAVSSEFVPQSDIRGTEPATAPSTGEESTVPSAAQAGPPGDTSPESVSLDTSLGMAILLAWVVGLAGGVAGLLWQMVRLVRLKRACVSPGVQLSAIWSQMASGSRRRRVRLLLSRRSRLPAACGYFRPAIIAPEALCRALSDEETRHLLLHELAHLNRYDDWGLLVHRLIQAVLWWHPIVWFISRKLDTERELSCDEVVASGGNRREYARTLVRVAEVASGSMVELAPGILRGNLTRRIESLLQVNVQPAKPATRARAGVAALSALGLAVWLSPPSIRLGREVIPLPAHREAGAVVAAYLDSVFSGYADSGFSGSVLLAMGGEVVLATGYGLADRERRIPATAETRYSVAGFTKMFTGAAILTLEDEGRLRVTDSLKRFFGRLDGSAGEVTLHQLLTHTDGLTRQNAPVYRSDPRAFIRAVSASPDSFAPGQGYRYNDFGHSVLGVIIEQASGTSYERFVRDRFLTPAGLSQTGFENEAGTYATEYAGPPGRQYPIPPRTYTWGRRASLGMVSTIGDMYRWVRALDDSRVISPRVRAGMFEAQGSSTWDTERGYGWDRMRQRDGSFLWRRVAGTPGMEGEILYDPVRQWTAVILVNSRVEWRFRVWHDIADAIAKAEG